MWRKLVGYLKIVFGDIWSIISESPTELSVKVVDQIKTIFAMVLLSLYAARLAAATLSDEAVTPERSAWWPYVVGSVALVVALFYTTWKDKPRRGEWIASGGVVVLLVWFIYWVSWYSLPSERGAWWQYVVYSVVAVVAMALFYSLKHKPNYRYYFVFGVLLVETIWLIYFMGSFKVGVASLPTVFFEVLALALLVWIVALLVLVLPRAVQAKKAEAEPGALWVRSIELSSYACWPLSASVFFISVWLGWQRVVGPNAKGWWVLPLLVGGTVLTPLVLWLSRPDKEDHSTGDLNTKRKEGLWAKVRRLWNGLKEGLYAKAHRLWNGLKDNEDWLVAAVVVVGVAVVTLLWAKWGGLSYYDAVNLILVAALVTVTMVYTRATKSMADEMQTQRHASLRPILVPKGIPERVVVPWRAPKEPLHSEWLSVENVGPGPAMGVRVRMGEEGEGEAEGEEGEYFVGVVAAGREEPIAGVDPGDWEYTGELRLTIIYEDVHGWEHETMACLTKESGRWDVEEVRQRPKPR